MRNTKYHYIRNDTIGDSSLADDMDRVAQYGGSTSLEAVAFVGTQDVNINNILDSVVIRLRRHTIFPGNEFEERIYELNMKEWNEGAMSSPPGEYNFWWWRLRSLIWRTSDEHYCIVQRLLDQAGFVEPRIQWGPPLVFADKFLRNQTPISTQGLSENERMCVICLTDFVTSGEQPTRVSCNHVVGIDCLGVWFKTNDDQGTCPLCRETLVGRVRDLRAQDMTPAELHRYLGIAGRWTEHHADECAEPAWKDDLALLTHWSVPSAAESGCRDYRYIETFELLAQMAEIFNNKRFDRDQWTNSMDDHYLTICRSRENESPLVPAPHHYAATISYDGLSQEIPLAYRALYYKVMCGRERACESMDLETLLRSNAEVRQVEDQLQGEEYFTPPEGPPFTLDDDTDEDMEDVE